MPNINRIRVNNIKYNFGTQQYDDFIMKFQGKNTIYDLANGGGKSVLMLLLLQNMIPNCTLDEKQPIEKLFRTSGGSKTIHSLIEWNLDECNIEDGYRYMLTGFCARKAKEESEEENKDTAAIEYFNYCIFYRNYNENDIINLPLSNGEERITYNGLKTYLRELEKKDLSLKVFVFTRKGEYQQFIHQYGIYESEWEIIKGINKTEGHVRTYFETNYKTTRKVVEDLLIEKIIEKSMQEKEQAKEEDAQKDMAKTLLDMKEKLVELSKQKQNIRHFDRQMELLEVLKGRIQIAKGNFQEKEDLQQKVGKLYDSVKNQGAYEEEEIQKEEARRESLQQEERKKIKAIEVLKLEAKKQDYTKLEEGLKKLEEELAALQREYQEEYKTFEEKECFNEYLQYKEDKRSYEEALATLQALSQGVDGLKDLHKLAFYKKQWLDQFLDQTNEEINKLTDQLSKEASELAQSQEQQKERELFIGVKEHSKVQLNEELVSLTRELNDLRKSVNILVLENVGQQQKESQEKYHRSKAQIEEKKQTLSVLEGKLLEEKLSFKELSAKKEATFLKLKDNLSFMKEYEASLEKIKKLMTVYQEEELEALIEKIRSRYHTTIGKKMAKEEKIQGLRKQEKALEEGELFLPFQEIAKVKEYIETRYQDQVFIGSQWLKEKEEQEREELLRNYPLLPYGVLVTNSYEALQTDQQIRELDLDKKIVPIFSLDNWTEEKEARAQEGLLLAGNQWSISFCMQSVEEELKKVAKKITEQEKKYDLLVAQEDTYKMDLEFALQFKKEYEHSYKEREKEGIALNGEILSLQKEMEQSEEREREYKQSFDTTTEEIEKLNQEVLELEQELKVMELMSQRISVIEEKEQLLKKEQKEVEDKKEELAVLVEEIATKKQRIKIMKEEEQAQIAAKNKAKEEWQQSYKEWYQEGEYEPCSDTVEEIDAKFYAQKSLIQGDKIAVEDKKQLMLHFQRNMERSLVAIKRKGYDVEQLAQLETKQLFTVSSEEYFIETRQLLQSNEEKQKRLKEQLEKEKETCHKLQGTIEYSRNLIRERYGDFEESLLTGESLQLKREEEEQLQRQLEKERKALEATLREKRAQQEKRKELEKDIERMIQYFELSVVEGEGEERDLATFEQQKESFLLYSKQSKSLKKQEEEQEKELEKGKLQTAEALEEMGAIELGRTLKYDVIVPKTQKEAEELMESLQDIQGYLQLEKSRIEKSISNIELIKENFELQCLQRCQNVKSQLERLPKLSSIVLDGQGVQMIKLMIPYEKEETCKEKMAEYIEDIIEKVDGYEKPEDKIQFIRNGLSLKRLFGVIVTDMNRIRMELYKRERIKEQSRFLRYEEAVGSTGQSQGIYIQFLVAIINYISNIHTINKNDSQLKKTIFIDNPFGAAKDVYIWEPIFELLKTNAVQLIVPARGATPAITARFDVNYILGQQMVGKRQQTVVVDYRSQVEQEEVEYRRLEFEQTSFDFI